MWPPTPSQARQLERLFDQQMWAFGRDAMKENDNLLLRLGATRTPPPAGSERSGTYRLIDGGWTFELNSVGVRASAGGSTVFLDRGPMEPQLRGLAPCSLIALLRWFARYERWVNACAGSAWRSASLASRTKPPFVPGGAMAARWEALAESMV